LHSKRNGKFRLFLAVLQLLLIEFYACRDFTMLSGILFVAVIVLMLFGLIAMFFPGKTITLIYASCGALLFCVYLIYDTQVNEVDFLLLGSS
jgi:FtsH-binding integral membrane protein